MADSAPELPRYLTVAEVAERLRTSPYAVLRLCRSHKLPAAKPFGKWLIEEDALNDHIAASHNRYSEAS